MVRVSMKKPEVQFNPSSISELKFIGNSTQLPMNIKNRYCNIDKKNKVISFYFELESKNNMTLIKPVKYWEWVCASQANKVICNHHKVFDGTKNHNLIEIASFDKPTIFIGKVDNPISETNDTLPEEYCRQRSLSSVLCTKILSRDENNLSTGFAIVNIEDIGLYIRAICNVEALRSIESPRIIYKELMIDNEIYKTDWEAVV